MRAKSFLMLFFGVVVVLSMTLDADARRRRRISGTLLIESTTKGAKVYIDGDEVGSIPMGNPIRLMPGQHTVKVTKPGHTQYMETIRIRRGRKVRLEVDLLPIAGVVTLLTSPGGARVYLDGKFAGKTPLRGLEIKAGKHTVRIAHIGFYDAIRKFQIVAGIQRKILVQLKSLPDNINPLIRKIPPKKWYEKWWVWASAAGGLVALVTAIAVPVAMSNRNAITDFDPDRIFQIPSR
jgi:PEGA domain